MNTQFYPYSAGQLAYLELGTGDRSVICLHSNSSCKEAFAAFANSELLNDWRFFLFDLPGHGQSDKLSMGSEFYTIEGMARLLNQFAIEKQIALKAVIGWSLGGHVALEMAAQYSDIEYVALSGTPPCGPAGEEIERAFIPSEHMALTSQVIFTESEAMLYAEQTLGANFKQFPHLIEAVKTADGQCRATMFSNWLQAGAGTEQKPFVEQWSGSLALLQGENDAFVSKAYLQSLNYKNLWSAEVCFIADAGHAPMLDQWDEYHRLIQAFLNQ